MIFTVLKGKHRVAPDVNDLGLCLLRRVPEDAGEGDRRRTVEDRLGGADDVQALRLKVRNRQITEAEHLIWTNINPTSLARHPHGGAASGRRRRAQFEMAPAHIIKVRDRKIPEIEATGAVLPFNSKNSWSDFLR